MGAAHEALAARRAVEPHLPVHAQAQLPYFPYASSEAADCAICLEPLRQGQLCSEVPACRHAFHRDCLAAWASTKGTCPLCRAKIVSKCGGYRRFGVSKGRRPTSFMQCCFPFFQ
ncbi:hypothetical protein PR202_gb17300 [Eleusine coracana subsp. coracana]|uniref:RING-type E3 ubiquitin transferase n=1 Tax=Eleusine coracana subsp. coracana TaxID=191504 RepID=A0AAV5F392_ELECO|nr:hypothetical protein PR202_gb17300 [Eleusine coracana subsp. coracana]